MNPESFSDYQPNLSQSQSLSQTVEELEVKLERLQGLAQTLIGGLMVAILITIGVSGWFAYRLILQEQQARRRVQEFQQTEVEIQEKLNNLEQKISAQQQQISQLREEIPDDLETVTNTVNSNQEQIEVLQNQIKRSNAESEEEKESENSNNE